MNNDRLKQELRIYFRCEADAAAPPQDWWQGAFMKATSPPQPKAKTGLAAWIRNLLDILRINPQRPFWGMATTVVVLLMLVVVSYGAGAVISNFPFGSGATPPTVIHPTVTGAPPAITVTLEASSSNQSIIAIILIFLLLVAVSLSILVWRWNRRTVTQVNPRETSRSAHDGFGRPRIGIAVASILLVALFVVVNSVGGSMRGGPMTVLPIIGFIILLALVLSYITRRKK